METPKVSVIVPCYNVEKYISRCVDSLLAQEYPNKEIILVDDGSTDSTSEILDGYAAENECVIVVHQSNAGVSEARNAGLKVAAGEYVMFPDPDDYVLPDYISHPVEAIHQGGCDMVVFGFWASWGGGRNELPIENYDLGTNEQILETFFPRFYGLRIDQFANWLRGGVFLHDRETGQVWRGIYRRGLI
ncbi:MAG: glycosyltransferase, partial [Muribaculaceae bacterium]|nr:glycosyltransferase [Muribaculaceae bacterium]